MRSSITPQEARSEPKIRPKAENNSLSCNINHLRRKTGNLLNYFNILLNVTFRTKMTWTPGRAAEAMLNALPADELGTALTTDKELAAALNSMGRHFVIPGAECELRGLPQPLPFQLIEGAKR